MTGQTGARLRRALLLAILIVHDIATPLVPAYCRIGQAVAIDNQQDGNR